MREFMSLIEEASDIADVIQNEIGKTGMEPEDINVEKSGKGEKFYSLDAVLDIG
jgi:hypothetical protein